MITLEAKIIIYNAICGLPVNFLHPAHIQKYNIIFFILCGWNKHFAARKIL